MYGLNCITGDKDMANGMRNISGKLLNEDEIEYVRSEIRAIEAEQETLYQQLPQSVLLARKARREMRLTGKTSVRCPKCGEAPVTTTTPSGERVRTRCSCGYLSNGYIVF